MAFGRTVLNLKLMPRLDARARPQAEPFVSIVVPARNESAVIVRTVRAFLAQDYPSFEVIVVDDRSTDGTAEVVEVIPDPRLTIMRGSDTPDGWLGKPWALEQGARRARGAVILFADADIFYEPQAVRSAVAELEKGDASLIALFPYFEMRGIGEHIGMSMMPFTLIAFPVWLLNRWQRPRFGIGGGAGNIVRREVLERIDFFARIRDAVIDDVALAQQVRRAGGSTHVVRAEHLVHLRMYHGARAIAEGFTKNVFTGFGRSYVLGAIFLVLYVTVHLCPYVWAVAGDRYALATVILISVTRALIFRALGYSLANALFLHPFMIVFWAYIFLRSVWFTGVLNRVRWRGRVYDAGRTRFGTGGDIRKTE